MPLTTGPKPPPCAAPPAPAPAAPAPADDYGTVPAAPPAHPPTFHPPPSNRLSLRLPPSALSAHDPAAPTGAPAGAPAAPQCPAPAALPQHPPPLRLPPAGHTRRPSGSDTVPAQPVFTAPPTALPGIQVVPPALTPPSVLHSPPFPASAAAQPHTPVTPVVPQPPKPQPQVQLPPPPQPQVQLPPLAPAGAPESAGGAGAAQPWAPGPHRRPSRPVSMSFSVSPAFLGAPSGSLSSMVPLPPAGAPGALGTASALGDAPSALGDAPSALGGEESYAAVVAERNALREQVETLRRQAENSKSAFEMLKKSNREAAARHSAELSALRERSQSTQDQLQAVVDPLTEENRSLATQVGELKNTAAKLKQEKLAIERLLAKMRDALQLALQCRSAAEAETRACREMIRRLTQEKDTVQRVLSEALAGAFAKSTAALQDAHSRLDLDGHETRSFELQQSAAHIGEDVKELEAALLKFQDSDETPPDIPSQVEKWRVQYSVLCASGLDPFGEPYCFDVPDAPNNIRWCDAASSPSQHPAGTAGTAGTADATASAAAGAPATPTGTGEAGAPLQGQGQQGQQGAEGSSSKKVLQCASVNKLIEVLTSPTVLDAGMVSQFLLMYRTFMGAQTLVKKLAVRYRISDANATPDVQTLVRLRVVDILCKWIERYPKDFADAEMKKLVRLFAAGLLRNTSKITLLFKLVNAPVVTVPLLSTVVPAAAASRTTEDTLLLDVPPTDLARQIALIDMAVFARIESTELLSPSNWTKTDDAAATPAVNVAAMTARFNRISDWVQCEVLKRDDCKERAKAIAHVLKVARECMAINDFNAAVAIGVALHTPSIDRLHQTADYLQKKVLSKKDKSFVQDLDALTNSSGNWKNLRATTDSAVLPGVPHLGMFLSDLFFIAEGNTDYVAVDGAHDKGLVNFAKKRMTASVIQRVQTFQRVPYRFEADYALQAWLESPLTIDPASFFERSKKLEPASC